MHSDMSKQTILVSISLIFSAVTYPVINSADIMTFYQFSKLFIPDFFIEIFYYLVKEKYISDILIFVPEFYI